MGTQRGSTTSKGCTQKSGSTPQSVQLWSLDRQNHGGLRLWHSHQVGLELRDGFDLASLLDTETIQCPDSREHQLELTQVSRRCDQQGIYFTFGASWPVAALAPGAAQVFPHMLWLCWVGGRLMGFPLDQVACWGHL